MKKILILGMILLSINTTVSAESKNSPNPLIKTCELGNAADCAILAYQSKGEDKVKYYAKSHSIYNSGCEKLISKSCIGLSVLYQFGHGIEKDKTKAKELRQKGYELGEKACYNGSGEACRLLSNEIILPNGVIPEDRSKSLKLMIKGCEYNDAESCAEIGGYYYGGYMVKKDTSKGYLLIKKGAILGSSYAKDMLMKICKDDPSHCKN